MFTGLVEGVGRIVARVGARDGVKLVVEVPAASSSSAAFEAIELGESISTAGVCLTVTKVVRHAFEADASAETLALTTLADAAVGARVNLERATKAHGRLGGHVVLGHVDGTGRVERVAKVGPANEVTVRVGAELAPFVARKGSIAIDGVSLTINSVVDEGAGTLFTLMLVPHTVAHTTLDALTASTVVNVEADVLARYVARQLDLQKRGVVAGREAPYRSEDDGTSVDRQSDERLLAALRRGGYA